MARNMKQSALRLVTTSTQAEEPEPVNRSGVRTRRSDTDQYYDRIKVYAKKIRGTSNITDIIAILDEALDQTRALHTTDEVTLARQQVTAAEQHIEKLKSELELVSKLVGEDQLTGTLNRRGLDHAMAHAEHIDQPLCVAVIDIDNFKKINDSFGHQVGDMAIMHLITIIKETIRSHDLIGRYGGDEFVLLLPDAHIKEASIVMTRLQNRLTQKPILWGHQELQVTFSAGIAERRTNEAGADLINRADHALYEAKRAGKDQVIVST